MDKELYNGIVFFDIKKAFNAVDNDILLSKLRKYGVLGIEFKWFMSYLTDHKQSCTLNEENFSFKIVKCGIPQSSCLGPLLFLIYISDLPSVLGRATSSMFADDTSMWVASDSVPELLHLLRNEITLLEKWMWDNKLTLNTLKTEFILISSIPKLTEIEETCCILIQDESIYRSLYTKSLGFFIDQHLNWEDHINHVIKKASAGIAIHRATSRYLPMDALQTIYRSLVESHIRYGNVVWGSCEEVLLTKLQKVQNRVAHIVTRSEFDVNAEPLIKKLRWKMLRELVRCDTAITMHKSMNKIAPTYLSKMFQPLKVIIK